ncbi:MAG: hypothetical protein QOK17_472 [Sphingomonadales bacterium]|jgi:3-oxoacyl-[acyl-carrier protein] reductase|nr:hypothetical protein [Sphingomonadales bacterium]
MRLEGKRIVVTGGANGLGAEYVRALHAEGAQVVIFDIDPGAAAALGEELGPGCGFEVADVSVPDSVEAAFASAAERMGGLDVLVNNAGVYPHRALEKISHGDWRNVMRVNLDGVFVCTSAALDHLRAAGGGKVVNIVTNLLWVMAPDMAHYIASKSGVLGFTRGAARELASWGITINALAPGANMPPGEFDQAGQERMREIIGYQVIKRPQFACDLTGAMVFLCSSDSDFMSGQVLCIDGGVATH